MHTEGKLQNSSTLKDTASSVKKNINRKSFKTTVMANPTVVKPEKYDSNSSSKRNKIHAK